MTTDKPQVTVVGAITATGKYNHMKRFGSKWTLCGFTAAPMPEHVEPRSEDCRRCNRRIDWMTKAGYQVQVFR